MTEELEQLQLLHLHPASPANLLLRTVIHCLLQAGKSLNIYHLSPGF